MGSLAINDNFLLSLFLFGLSFCGVSVVTHTYKHQNLRNSLNQPPRPTRTPQGRYYRLTCLLEDIPQTLLRGQSYQLAMPLLSPIACLLEDAPQTVFKGQTCELATPLMTTLACIVTPTWQAFYTKQLGKPKINYWEWKIYPNPITFVESYRYCGLYPPRKDIPTSVRSVSREQKFIF
ncbi:hypothetical protein HC931_00605 [Candidatus Gracilibacteria bacterium]|nr:hypothetical protein [Candidatus Gracilibacteria bacterium]